MAATGSKRPRFPNWMWATNMLRDDMGNLKNTVKVCHSRWQIENKCFNETAAGTRKADHIYRHIANAIIAILLLLFICINIFNIFIKEILKTEQLRPNFI